MFLCKRRDVFESTLIYKTWMSLWLSHFGLVSILLLKKIWEIKVRFQDESMILNYGTYKKFMKMCVDFLSAWNIPK